MKISTEIASAAALVGEEKAVEYTAKAGFDAWDFSMFDMCKYDWSAGCFLPNDNPLASDNYLAFARRLKQIGLDNGILCNQSHAPFPSRGPTVPRTDHPLLKTRAGMHRRGRRQNLHHPSGQLPVRPGKCGNVL